MIIPKVPGTPDAAYLGFALVTELINILIERGVIDDYEIDAMLARLMARIDVPADFAGQRAAEVVRGTMLRQK